MKRSIIFLVLSIVLVLGAAAQNAHAFYKWVDDQGILHVTDSPPPAKYAPKPEPAEEPEQQQAPAPTPAPPRVQQTVPAPPPPPMQQTVPSSPPPPPTKAAPAPVSAVPPAAKPAPSVPKATPPTASPTPVPMTAVVPTAPPKTAPGPATSVTATPAPAAPAPGTPIPISPAPPRPAPAMPQGMPSAAGLIGALVGGFMLTIIGVAAGLYLYFSLCLFKIAKKLNVQAAWAAWVPILSVWPFMASAGKPLWWILLLFIPLVNLIVGIAAWMSISENLGKGRMLGLLMLLPFVNLIILGYLAFSRAE